MWWRWSVLVVGVLASGGCLDISCQAEDPCPGHAVFPGDWNLSECACPPRWGIASRSLERTPCTQPNLVCVDDYPGSGAICWCERGPEGPWIWRCDAPDFAVTRPLDFSIVDFATVDEGFSD